MFFGDKSKIRSQIIKPVDEVSDEIEEIVLEEPVRDNLMPNRLGKDADKLPNSLDAKNNQMINYTGYDLDPSLLLLQESSEEFKKLPSETKAKIRLAKANNQINKNSKNINNSRAL